MAERNYVQHQQKEEDDDEINEGIELSLGLSLNGKFGIDPNAKLRRSFSISGGSDFSWVGGSGLLSRTCSLPVKHRKRKEVQMVRRWEAKQRRVQKMTCGSGSDVQGQSQSSSGFDSQCDTPFPGTNRNPEAKSPQSVQSLDDNENGSLPTKLKHNMNKVAAIEEVKPTRYSSDTSEMARNMLADMPYVSTKGAGPNGKHIEGFLYRYRKGEEVRIVCVCHGSFLTPIEFIKHAGGEDVEHPLRHIIVSSSSFL